MRIGERIFCCIIKSQLDDGELKRLGNGDPVKAALKACEVQVKVFFV